jgi:hypothetical protein
MIVEDYPTKSGSKVPGSRGARPGSSIVDGRFGAVGRDPEEFWLPGRPKVFRITKKSVDAISAPTQSDWIREQTRLAIHPL